MKRYIFVGVAVISIGLTGCTRIMVKEWESYKADLHDAYDETNYDTLKEVEDTCRSMISSYESDRLVYEQYKDSENKEKQSWTEQAKMRANKTASTYNNYILKNTHVWADDVPEDIKSSLDIVE